MKVLVLGASGIIGSHMRLCVPPDVEAKFYRAHPDPHDPICLRFNAAQPEDIANLLDAEQPDAVVNLIGESRVDHVEHADAAEENRAYWLNVRVPFWLAAHCHLANIRYIHVSSQAVFSGDNPPYGPDSPIGPAVNRYGQQKVRAEELVRDFRTTVIVRPSLVLGKRPFPHVGRKNPLEGMMDGTDMRQVHDRYFSPLFARDAATGIWNAALSGSRDIVHLGIPIPLSRYQIAECVKNNYFAHVEHADFRGIAPRPKDTTYNGQTTEVCPAYGRIQQIMAESALTDRAREIALFSGRREDDACSHLSRGFSVLHDDVTADFRAAGAGESPEALRNWYMKTSAYIWELSAYHEDERFNYAGMVRGIADRLAADGAESVLTLGDGIGDMTLAFRNSGLHAVYHDLAGSLTARYADFRYWRQTGRDMPKVLTESFWPDLEGQYDAIVSADFLEHMPNVADWVKAIWSHLTPGGLFFAQNAFACGSGPDGPMPMHLAENDHWEKDWDPMLAEIGFVQLSSNWYAKKK